MKRTLQAPLAKRRNHVVSIEADDETMHFTVIDAQTQRPIDEPTAFKCGKSFIAGIESLITKQTKAVILNIFHFKNHGFDSNYQFCQVIRENLNRLQIPHHFISIGDTVFITTVTEQLDLYLISEFENTETGYERLKDHHVPISGATRDKIFANKNPAKIIGFDIHPSVINGLQKLLKCDNLVILDGDYYLNANFKFICEIAKWVKNKSSNKFYVAPMTTMQYTLVGFVGDIQFELHTVDGGEKLPLTKTVAIPKTVQNYNIMIKGKEGIKILETNQLNKECHKNGITLKIDEEYFCSVLTTKILIPEILALPKTLYKIQQSKIPVIGFWDNSSVICVSKNGGNYKFLEQWNGLFGKEIFLNFNKERPTLDGTSLASNEAKMDTVVFDILKIMAMPDNNIKVDEKWKFIFTKDADHPVLLEFKTFDGTKKQASPAFLMAILLRKQFEAIKKEFREKPKQVGFCFFDKFDEDERKRVGEKLQEFCQRLKFRCTFIKLD
uniref:Uncharacterized protein n=1 Tax=Panagrolaimus sp. ES5 TaxID=591445 RepID=A0AC34F6D0_9BILA